MTTYTLAPCPFCHRAAHARACAELRRLLFADDPEPMPEPIPDATPDTEGPDPL